MFLGLLYAVIACAIWGLIYIFPLILPEYDPVMIASARFAVYGMACLLFVPFQIKELKKLTRSDWFFAMASYSLRCRRAPAAVSSTTSPSAVMPSRMASATPQFLAARASWRAARSASAASEAESPS